MGLATRVEAKGKKDEGDGDEDNNRQCGICATEVTQDGCKVDPSHDAFQGRLQGALRAPKLASSATQYKSSISGVQSGFRVSNVLRSFPEEYS